MRAHFELLVVPLLTLCFTAVLSSCGGGTVAQTTQPLAPSAVSGPTEIVYVGSQSSKSITTYDISPSDLSAQPSGSPLNLGSFAAIHAPLSSADGRFVYVQTCDTQFCDIQGHGKLLVFRTDSTGAPEITPVQSLEVAADSRLLVHPSGKFVYLLETFVSADEQFYSSNLRLLNVDAQTGMLTEDPNIQVTYGPDAFWLPSFVGISTDGTQLYDELSSDFDSTSGAKFSQHSIDLATGKLGPAIPLYEIDSNQGDIHVALINSRFIAEYLVPNDAPESAFFNLFSSSPQPATPLIHCTSAMLSVCGNASSVQTDPAAQNLFFVDPIRSEISIVHVDLTENQLEDTGSRIPVASPNLSVWFSPDGSLVYVMDRTSANENLMIYGFDPATGKLSSHSTTLPLPSDWMLSFAVRQN